MAGILAVDGDPAVADVHAITGVRALTLFHVVAGIHAVSDVSSTDGLTVTGVHNLHVFLVLLLLAPILFQVFLLLKALL